MKTFKMSAKDAKRLASNLSFEKGLITVVTRSARDKVLMVAFMDRKSLLETLTTGFMHYYSRKRGKIWMKGETSGFRQRVLEVRVNCENNSLLFTVDQEGAGACHMGYETCFYRKIGSKGSLRGVEKRTFRPEHVYKDLPLK